SAMIGNGATHWFHALLSFYDMACTSASVPPVLGISTCVAIKNGLGRCRKWTQQSCIDQFDAINCAAASNFCNDLLFLPYINSGMNPYDISKKCEGVIEEYFCYPFIKHIVNYLSDPIVRDELGVDHHPAIPTNFTQTSFAVNEAFDRNLDLLHESTAYIGALLEHRVRVLIYVGTYDWICNWVGNERWTLELEWERETRVCASRIEGVGCEWEESLQNQKLG
ncbi:hypothetical protein MPER_07799, partial [Moniliophthora perniciosa FA553]